MLAVHAVGMPRAAIAEVESNAEVAGGQDCGRGARLCGTAGLIPGRSRSRIRGLDCGGVGTRNEGAERIAGFLAERGEVQPDVCAVGLETHGVGAGVAGFGEVAQSFPCLGAEELGLCGVGKWRQQGGDFGGGTDCEQGGGESEGEFEALGIGGERETEAFGGGRGMAGVEKEIAAEKVELGIGRVEGQAAVEPCGGGGDVAGVESVGGGAQGDLAVERSGAGGGAAFEERGGIGFAVLGHELSGTGKRGLAEGRLGHWRGGMGLGDETRCSVGGAAENRNLGETGAAWCEATGKSVPTGGWKRLPTD